MSEANVQYITSSREAQFIPSYPVYISGPMRGHKDLNRPMFAAVAKRAAEMGWKAFNPADEGPNADTVAFSVSIRKDVKALLEVKAIVLLPGWRQSEGARFEVEVARNLGLSFYEAKQVDGIAPHWIIVPSSPPEAGAEGIDQEARRLVYGDRAATYGHPRGDFDRVAKFWSGIVGTDITAEQVAIMMVAFKLARLSQTPGHHDSQVDTIGYMLCLARLQEDPTEIAAWPDENTVAAVKLATSPKPLYATLHTGPPNPTNPPFVPREAGPASGSGGTGNVDWTVGDGPGGYLPVTDKRWAERYAQWRQEHTSNWAGPGFSQDENEESRDGK